MAQTVAIALTSLLHAAAAAKSLQSCPTLCDPVDSSPLGSPIPGILQARTLEWAAISFFTLHAVCAKFVESKMELHFPPLFLKKNGPNPNRPTSALSVRTAAQPPRPVHKSVYQRLLPRGMLRGLTSGTSPRNVK